MTAEQRKGAGGRRGEEGDGLSFIDHDRQRYAAKVRLGNQGEILIGDHRKGGGVGPLGEFRIVLHDLGDRGGRLHPQLCVFGDGAAALGVLLGREGADLAALLAPAAGHEALSRRLLALGLPDASDTPLADATEVR